MFELTSELNEYAKKYNSANEIIDKEDIIKAIYFIDNLYIDNEIDVLVFLLSLNLCNAYAKQIDNHDIYKFKKDIATLIKIINERNIPNLKVCTTNDKGNLYIFEVGNIQFSFHDEKQVDINNFYYQEMKWDGIRKQPCAKTLFNKCLDNEITNNMKNMTGELIKPNIEKLINNYHDNKLSFEEIINNI